MEFQGQPPGLEPNPYAAPASLGGPVAFDTTRVASVPASRGTRFGALWLDRLLFFGVALPGFIWLMIAALSNTDLSNPAPTTPAWDPAVVGLPMVAIGIPVLVLAIFQWYLTATTGQSLAKRWLAIRVVKLDGSPVDFVSGVLLRVWVPGVIAWIPYVGSAFSLVDALLIFRDDSRCIHDHIAGTRVVVVESVEPVDPGSIGGHPLFYDPPFTREG